MNTVKTSKFMRHLYILHMRVTKAPSPQSLCFTHIQGMAVAKGMRKISAFSHISYRSTREHIYPYATSTKILIYCLILLSLYACWERLLILSASDIFKISIFSFRKTIIVTSSLYPGQARRCKRLPYHSFTSLNLSL